MLFQEWISFNRSCQCLNSLKLYIFHLGIMNSLMKYECYVYYIEFSLTKLYIRHWNQNSFGHPTLPPWCVGELAYGGPLSTHTPTVLCPHVGLCATSWSPTNWPFCLFKWAYERPEGMNFCFLTLKIWLCSTFPKEVYVLLMCLVMLRRILQSWGS